MPSLDYGNPRAERPVGQQTVNMDWLKDFEPKPKPSTQQKNWLIDPRQPKQVSNYTPVQANPGAVYTPPRRTVARSPIMPNPALVRRSAKPGVKYGFGLQNLISPIEGADLYAEATSEGAGVFGPRINPYTHRHSYHTGIDISKPMGTPILAPTGAMVDTVNPNGGAYGQQIILDHGRDVQTMYGHLSKFNVEPGQRVRRGDIIGYVGSTGYSTGPHLHWETWRNGQAVNPLTFLGN